MKTLKPEIVEENFFHFRELEKKYENVRTHTVITSVMHILVSLNSVKCTDWTVLNSGMLEIPQNSLHELVAT